MNDYRALLSSNDSDVFNAISEGELRQADGVEMIPSENYTYPEVLAALGSVMTNKYAEGYPGRRYYGGQQYSDAIENLARDRACSLFGPNTPTCSLSPDRRRTRRSTSPCCSPETPCWRWICHTAGI